MINMVPTGAVSLSNVNMAPTGAASLSNDKHGAYWGSLFVK